MELSEKLSEQLKALESGLIDFKKSLDANMSKYDELEQNWIKNAQVQKFEFCIELLWKAVKTYFEIEGKTLLTPKLNIKELYLHQIVEEKQYLELMKCIESRNLLSHVYKSETFELIAADLLSHYNIINTTFGKLKNIFESK